MGESAAARKARLAKIAAKTAAPAPPVAAVDEEPIEVEYPPREEGVERPDIVMPEPEIVEEAAEAPEKPGLYFVTDLASYGPVKLGETEKPLRVVKGTLYPFAATAEIGRLMSKGVIRMATDADKRRVRIAEGPGGPTTSANMHGVGIKRQ